MVVLSMRQKWTSCPITRARTLASTIRQHYENDLTYSNAAKVAGSRSLQAPCGRTVDFTQHPEKPKIPRSVASTKRLILAGKNQNQLRLSGNRIPPRRMRTQIGSTQNSQSFAQCFRQFGVPAPSPASTIHKSPGSRSTNYSDRSAAMGSMEIALRAGTRHAIPATTSSSRSSVPCRSFLAI